MDQDVDPTVVVQRRFDDRASASGFSHGLSASDGFASRRLYLLRRPLRGTGVHAFPLQAAAGIVDDDSCSPRREKLGIGAPQPSACAGDHGYTIVESELGQ